MSPFFWLPLPKLVVVLPRVCEKCWPCPEGGLMTEKSKLIGSVVGISCFFSRISSRFSRLSYLKVQSQKKVVKLENFLNASLLRISAKFSNLPLGKDQKWTFEAEQRILQKFKNPAKIAKSFNGRSPKKTHNQRRTNIDEQPVAASCCLIGRRGTAGESAKMRQHVDCLPCVKRKERLEVSGDPVLHLS